MDAFDWQGRLDSLHAEFSQHSPRPVIGITGNFGDKGCELAAAYYRSVEAAGGTPVVLPPTDQPDVLRDWLGRIDGLLLSGGADLNPLFLGQDPLPGLGGVNAERDAGELLLVRLAFNRQVPMLGICRGCQLMAAALGGGVCQDLRHSHPGGELLKHSQDQDRGVASHRVRIEPGTLLDRLFPGGSLAVNSFHHQAVEASGPHLCVVARSADGVVEAVESSEKKPLLGVQWHPECFLSRGDRSMLPVFAWLVGEARTFAGAQRLHDRILTFDSHCDTPMFFDQGIRLDRRDPRLCVDLHKMTEGRLDATVMVAYLKQEARDAGSLKAAAAKADRILGEIEAEVNRCNGVELARTPADLYRLKREGKKAVMLGIENGYALGDDLGLVAEYRRRGVVYMTLCHNGDNDVCDSARGTGEHGGVSDFGRRVIAEMNRVGMLVDLSHASEKSFYDALELSRVPIVCSHSSARALCDHPRNLTDGQLRALAEKGGVAQVTFYGGFLRNDGRATIDDAVAHLNHMVEVAGTDHVGIGTDFDGDGGVPGCASAAELIRFTCRLLEEGYGPDEIASLWGENFLRVMRQAQAEAPDFLGTVEQ